MDYFERANGVRGAEQFSRMNKVKGAVTTSGLKGIRTVSHCRIRIRKKESPMGYRRLPSGNIAKEAQEVPLVIFLLSSFQGPLASEVRECVSHSLMFDPLGLHGL